MPVLPGAHLAPPGFTRSQMRSQVILVEIRADTRSRTRSQQPTPPESSIEI